MREWSFLFSKPKYNGPVTIKKKRKAWLIYAICFFIGLIPHLYGMGPLLETIGMGIMIPGGGFFALGGAYWPGFLISIVLFLVSVFFWWATGNMIGPFFVWGVSDIVAACMVGDLQSAWDTGLYIVIAIAAVYFLLGRITTQIYQSMHLKDQKKRLAEIPHDMEEMEKVCSERPDKSEMELDDLALATQAFMFDQALAPYGEFRGFNVIEQFQPSAVRYQINAMLNALQTVQCHYTPNYHGAAAEAQRKLIELYQHPLVWSYWEKEELWGNLRRNADPVPKRDNVMLTGFFLPNLTMYMKNTGDMRYEDRGSITFKKNEKHTFKHSVHTIAESIVGNWEASPFTVYACEPNWLYSVCNWKAFQGMTSYDNLFGTSYWADHEEKLLSKYRDELVTPNGTSLLFRSARTGWVAPPVGMACSDAMMCMFYSVVVPEWSKAYWAHVRSKYFIVQDGKIVIKPGLGFDHGCYGPGQSDNLSSIMMIAGELGDMGVAEAARESLIASVKHPINGEGLMRWQCSNEVNAQILMGLTAFSGAWRDACGKGPEDTAFTGPILEELDFKKVWVARAISDGHNLELTLKNAVERFAGKHELGIERLIPNKAYRIKENGHTFVADGEGKARIFAEIQGRTHVTIEPQVS